MPDTCNTCLFFRAGFCKCDTPKIVPGLYSTNGTTPAVWPSVDADDWCGKGVDSTDYHPFTPYPPAP